MDWKKIVDHHLDTASIILLLISADFVASDYCYGIEMQRAMERHEAGETHIIPILLRPVDWQSAPFGKLKALPSNGTPITEWRNRDAAFADVAKGIRSIVEGPLNGDGNVPKSRDTIYLARIIDPPCWGRVTKTTLWLAAEGKITYIIDSITIRHKWLVMHWGAGNITGAVSPDAEYVFSIEAGKTCSLCFR
jgi:hypothetical protein